MAFMMPVMKNDYDIYKSARSRRASDCSSNTPGCRSRKVSECKSEGHNSYSTSPGSDFVGSPAHRSGPIPMSRQYSHNSYSRSSRTSQNSLQSPCKSSSNSPPKSNSANSLNKFHYRLVDRLKKSLKCKDSSDGDVIPNKNNNGQTSTRVHPKGAHQVEQMPSKSWPHGLGQAFIETYFTCGPKSRFSDARRAS